MSCHFMAWHARLGSSAVIAANANNLQCNSSMYIAAVEMKATPTKTDFLTAFLPLAMATAAAVAESLPSTNVVVCFERIDPRV